MTPIREMIARAITDDAWDATYEMGRTSAPITGGAAFIPDAEAARMADAVLRALDEAGCVVVETDPVSEARRGLEWFERTFGVPLGDMPGRLDVERVRAMISTAPPASP